MYVFDIDSWVKNSVHKIQNLLISWLNLEALVHLFLQRVKNSQSKLARIFLLRSPKVKSDYINL